MNVLKIHANMEDYVQRTHLEMFYAYVKVDSQENDVKHQVIY